MLLRTFTVGRDALELRPVDNAGTGALAALVLLRPSSPPPAPAQRLDRRELEELREAIDEALA